MALVAILLAAAISGQGDGAFMSSGFVTAILGTGGIAGVLGYLGGRKHRVTVEPTVCEERHKNLDDQVKDMYARLIVVEKETAAQGARLQAIDNRIGSMDGKLDTIIGKIGK